MLVMYRNPLVPHKKKKHALVSHNYDIKSRNYDQHIYEMSSQN